MPTTTGDSLLEPDIQSTLLDKLDPYHNILHTDRNPKSSEPALKESEIRELQYQGTTSTIQSNNSIQQLHNLQPQRLKQSKEVKMQPIQS